MSRKVLNTQESLILLDKHRTSRLAWSKVSQMSGRIWCRGPNTVGGVTHPLHKVDIVRTTCRRYTHHMNGTPINLELKAITGCSPDAFVANNQENQNGNTVDKLRGLSQTSRQLGLHCKAPCWRIAPLY